MMGVVDDTISRLKKRGVNVKVLNITQLSEFRKEGHPSIYRKQWEPLREDQLSDPKSYADCIHWCLPGVPDVWNELLYAYIIYYSWLPIWKYIQGLSTYFSFCLKLSYRNKSNFIGHLWLGKYKEKKILNKEEK